MRCQKCRQELNGTERFCGKCGYPIGNAAYGNSAQTAQKKVPITVMVMATGIIIAIFCLTAAITYSAIRGKTEAPVAAIKTNNTPTTASTMPASGVSVSSTNNVRSAQYYELLAKEYDMKVASQQKSVDFAYKSLQNAIDGKGGGVISAQNYYNSACSLLKTYQEIAARYHALAQQSSGK